MIHLEHVTKLYGTVIGVNDLQCQLEPGAYGLIGPNGSGKTTLINLLTGNLRPSLGSLTVMERTPWRHRGLLRRIGLCPASDILLPSVSALEWVTYQTAMHGFRTSEARRRARHALEQAGLGTAMRDRMGTYSLGMRQRVKLAQAIAHDPDLLILDEPFNGLDPIGRHDMTEFLKQWASSGRSLILASHILHEVEAVTSAFLLIHGGRLLASGQASEVQADLVDYPQEVRLRGRGLENLAAQLVQSTGVDRLEFNFHRDEMTLHVRHSEVFFRELVELAQRPGVALQSVESSQGSLDAAFEALLRRHRGEA
jgi:ABC-2 type transport system ATP-binding protein